MTKSKQSNSLMIRVIFTFTILATMFFTNLNVVIAAPTDQANATAYYPSKESVKRVTLARTLVLEEKQTAQAQERIAHKTAITAEQLAYQKKQDEIARQKAAAAKAAAAKKAAEEAKKAAAAKAAAEKAAAAKAAQQRAAQAAAQRRAAVQTAARRTTTTSTRTTTSSSSTSRTFKISFYDPAVLGSSMGYGGVAANLSVFPRGTRLRISMSNGQTIYRTVNDTGTFAYSNPYQLDVAWPNSQIPAAGILSATVTVVG